MQSCPGLGIFLEVQVQIIPRTPTTAAVVAAVAVATAVAAVADRLCDDFAEESSSPLCQPVPGTQPYPSF